MAAPQKMFVTEAVGIFDGHEELQETIRELGSSGFGRHQISVRGSDAELEKRFGSATIHPLRLEDNPAAPRSYLVSAEELGVAQGVLVGAGIYISAALAIVATNGMATSGAMVTVVLASILGGVIGTMLAQLLEYQYARFFQRQSGEGGLVLWVKSDNDVTVKKAQRILEKHGAHDVHVHQIVTAE